MIFETFLMIAATAVFSENAVLVKGLGINRWVELQSSAKKILWYSGIFAWTSLITTLVNTFMISAMENVEYGRYLRVGLYVVVVLVVYTINFFLIRLIIKDRDFLITLYRLLPITTFNTALFSVFYVVLNRQYSYLQASAYSIGTSIGYFLGLLIIFAARKRLMLSPISRSMRGTPILLLYLGLLSLALYGLIGYSVSA